MKIQQMLSKILATFLSAILLGLLITGCNNTVSNTYAERNEKSRFLMISHEDTIKINQLFIFVGDGKEIEEMRLDATLSESHSKQLDDPSVTLEVPKNYSERTEFTVVVIDIHGLKYVKVVSDVAEFGETEIRICESDYQEESGDLWKKIVKWFNG